MPDGRPNNGYSSKETLQAYQAKWRATNADRLKAYQRTWYSQNRDALLQKQRKYRAANLDSIRANDREYCRRNTERNRRRVREWQKANPGKVRVYQLRTYYANKDKWRERNSRWQRISPTRKAWKLKNRDHLNLLARHYYHTHPARREYLRNWRSRSPRRIVLLAKWRKVSRLCYICGRYLKKREITVDHVIPRKHNGSHDMRNVMPCHGICNSRKNARLDYPVARPELIEVGNA